MKKRLIALLLCLVMLVTCMGVGVFMPPDIKLLDASSGEEVSSVSVPQSDRVQLATDYKSSGEPGYQWQLSADGKTWINIYGQTGESVQLSYAMVCNMLNDEGTVQVRCMVTDGESEYASRAAEVSVDYSAPARPAQAAKAPVSVAPASVAPVSDPAPASEGETQGTKTIIIKYVFQNGEQAANPWTATLPENDTMTRDVESPVVIGYAPNHEVVHVDSSTQITYEVVYSPTFVNFTVKHYLQNISNDEYILDATDIIGNKKTEDPVGDGLQKTYEGFTALLYDTTTKIAADGSTVVEIYYDRNYYLLNLDLDGGYGAEPMYARYGTKVEIADPTRAGYTFAGWTPSLPETILAKNMTCKAGWTPNDKAKVTVVIWGENADNEKYSYQSSFQIEAQPGTELTQADLNGKLACGKEEHTHSAACGNVCSHQHDFTCYGLPANAQPIELPTTYKNEQAKLFEKLSGGVQDGYIYYFNDNGSNSSGDKYYLRLDGKWYQYSAKPTNNIGEQIGERLSCKTVYGKIGHDADYAYKYGLEIYCTHTHIDSCYTCGKEAHKHNSDCYYNANAMDSKLWKLVKSDTVTVAADGSTVMNLYYDRTEFTLTFVVGKNTVKTTITEKWGADIHSNFPIKDGNQTIWWTVPDGCKSFKPKTQLGSIDTMPAENIRFTSDGTQSGATLYYCVEVLNGENGTHTHGGKTFKIYKQMTLEKNCQLTYTEEFHDITGFKQWTSDPKFDKMEQGGVAYDSYSWGNYYIKDNNYLYYTRNSYELSFYNYDCDLTDKTTTVQYQAALNSHYFEPEYPSALEAGAYKFDGWYTTSGCYAESKVNFDTQTMPAADVKLFAKWVPVTHTVRTWLTDELDKPVNVGDSNAQIIVHRDRAVAPETPQNGNYTFVNWFYKDNGVEKAFDFSMPVTQDMDIYAKWSSNKLVEYTIKYQLENGTEIAPPSTGSALAGTTKTFEAKSGDKLNEGYKTGYYPQTSSHSITFNIEGGNDYTFIYVEKQKVEYTVKYLEKGTEKKLAEPKTVTTNAAIVTETFKQVKGYAPDAYQKKLVLAAENNEIIFWYTKDDVHAPVQVIHWIQSVSGNGYTEYQSSTNLNGVIGNPYSESPLTIKGFKYNAADSNPSGTLTEAGLVLNLYYDRVEYPYEFRFLEQGTNKPLTEPTTGIARYEALVSEAAKEIAGYTLVSAATQSMTIGVEEPENVAQNNVKTFYYKEKSVDIKYEVVGPAGCGTLTNYAETVKVLTGTAQGSTAAVSSPTYKFVGWYSDEACTQLVGSENTFVPQKAADNMYQSATYYAKFDYNVVDLTITKTISGKDSQQLYGERSFVFHVKGIDENTERIDIDVVVKIENGQTTGSVVLKALPIGSYTITEDTGWSWRYGVGNVGFTGVSNHSNTGATASCTLVGGKDNAVTFTNSWLHAQWLSFTTSVQNIFGNK